MGSETMHALVSTVSTFWPDGEPAEWVRGRGGATSGSTGFAVIPSAASPRLLVPLGNAAAAGRSLQRYSAALGVPEAVRRMAMGTALRLGAARVFGDRVEVGASAGTDSLTGYLSGVLKENVTFSLGIGNARVNRKPVLQVFGPKGQDLAFVKIGNTPVSKAQVTGESNALEALATKQWSRLAVPRVLHTGIWNGMFVLVMSPLPTSLQLTPKSRRTLPRQAMDELSAAFSEGTQPLTCSPLWGRLEHASKSLEDDNQRERLLQALQVVAGRAHGRPWQIGAWHGDWTPWNMARLGQTVQLWDWERFETGVPFGLDKVHFTVNEYCRTHGIEVETIRAGLEAAVGEKNDTDSESYLLAAIYLLAITCRYLTLAQGPGGDAISRQGQMTLRTLCDWLGVRG